MSISMMNDILSLLSKEYSAINDYLKNIADFQRENYKALVRKNIIELDDFDKEQAKSSTSNAIAMIRKFFPQTMGKKPFYNELITELVAEEFGDPTCRRQRAHSPAGSRMCTLRCGWG